MDETGDENAASTVVNENKPGRLVGKKKNNPGEADSDAGVHKSVRGARPY